MTLGEVSSELLSMCYALLHKRRRLAQPGFAGIPRRYTLAKEYIMEISARNQLKGTIKQITRGSVNGEVLVDIGGQTVTSSITLASIDRLALKVGDSVTAIVKATDVMIGK